MTAFALALSVVLGLSVYGKMSRLKMMLIMRLKALTIATVLGVLIEVALIVWAWLL